MDTKKAQMIKETFFKEFTGIAAAARIFNDVPDIYFFVKNSERQVVSANRAFFERMGHTHEHQIIGTNSFDMAPVELARKYDKDDCAVINTGKEIINRIELNRGHDGSVKWLTTSKTPILRKNGQVAGILGIARDIHRVQHSLESYGDLNPVISYIDDNYDKRLTIEELTRKTRFSRRQFERIFKKVMGVSPAQYIIQVRINKACHLILSSDDNLSSIAYEVGFCDHSTLTKYFVRYLSMTPKQYRNNYKQHASGMMK